MKSRIPGRSPLAVALSWSAAARRTVWALAAGVTVLGAVAGHAAEVQVAAVPPAAAGGREASVEEITFRAGNGGPEVVCIRFDQRLIPIVWSIEGEKPRVVIDAEPVARAAAKLGAMKVNGKLVWTVRSYLNGKKKRLRVVLDMRAGGDYYVDRTFREADNLYCLSVTEQVPAAEKTGTKP
ncbi:MAG TPA: hypothetical protein PLB96_13620 [Syntrophales bacterium]|nr:hypothetical protein [Syntrophales bacterium]